MGKNYIVNAFIDWKVKDGEKSPAPKDTITEEFIKSRGLNPKTMVQQGLLLDPDFDDVPGLKVAPQTEKVVESLSVDSVVPNKNPHAQQPVGDLTKATPGDAGTPVTEVNGDTKTAAKSDSETKESAAPEGSVPPAPPAPETKPVDEPKKDDKASPAEAPKDPGAAKINVPGDSDGKPAVETKTTGK